MSLSAFLREAETRYVREALRQAGGNISIAAGLMGTDTAEAQRRVDESLDA
jgi:hypothetical protein